MTVRQQVAAELREQCVRAVERDLSLLGVLADKLGKPIPVVGSYIHEPIWSLARCFDIAEILGLQIQITVRNDDHVPEEVH